MVHQHQHHNGSKFDSNNNGEYALRNLPEEVLASVLGIYSCGKTISTFILVAYGDNTLRAIAYMICRNALVERYIVLSKKVRHIYEQQQILLDTNTRKTEISDTIDIIREDIRLSTDHDDQIMLQFSYWCAILDYFEIQLAATTTTTTTAVPSPLSSWTSPQWIIWCGNVEITYGMIHGYVVTPDWTVCALQYWYNHEVSSQLSFTHPRNNDFIFIPDDQIPYGTLFGINSIDRLRLERQCSDLEVHTLRDTTSAQRVTLVPINESYDICPSMVLVDHSYVCRTHAENIMYSGPLLIDTRRQSLCYCWDKELSEDLWDDAISHLGEFVIRIMTSFHDEFTITLINKLYRNCREFSNQ